jgi:hypothetical protein
MDDPQSARYIELFSHNGITSVIANENDCVVQATNHAAKRATGDILIYLSDDFMAPNAWDLQILQALNKNFADETAIKDGLWLLKVDDCLQKFDVPVLTIPIMSSALCKKLGYFWHPDFKSMFCDEHLFWICKNNGWLYLAPELQFTHEHCSVGKAVRDETYIRSERNWDSGKETFNKHKAAGFPLGI